MYILAELDKLVPHEMHNQKHALDIAKDIERRGVLLRPIVIHNLGNGRYMIVDGHHRTAALRHMGCRYIAATAIDYSNSDIKVMSWGEEKEWRKEDIISRAIRGELLPPKTTKHVIRINGRYLPFQDNDYIEPIVAVELRSLREGY